MKDILAEVNSPLFDGVAPEDRKAMLGCIGYHIGTFRRGDVVAFEEENIKHIGIILKGSGVYIYLNKKLNVSAGDVVFIPENIYCYSEWQGDPEIEVVYISCFLHYDGLCYEPQTVQCDVSVKENILTISNSVTGVVVHEDIAFEEHAVRPLAVQILHRVGVERHGHGHDSAALGRHGHAGGASRADGHHCSERRCTSEIMIIFLKKLYRWSHQTVIGRAISTVLAVAVWVLIWHAGATKMNEPLLLPTPFTAQAATTWSTAAASWSPGYPI